MCFFFFKDTGFGLSLGERLVVDFGLEVVAGGLVVVVVAREVILGIVLGVVDGALVVVTVTAPEQSSIKGRSQLKFFMYNLLS